MVTAVVERDGLPIDVGRSRRVVSARLRRALQVRDRTCRFPGCGVPAHKTHAHHVEHWVDGGRTDLSNLVSLCGFHHRRLHDGAFAVAIDADGAVLFETTDGVRIGGRPRQGTDAGGHAQRPWTLWRGRAWPAPDAAKARAVGERLDLNYTVEVVAGICEVRARGAVPLGP